MDNRTIVFIEKSKIIHGDRYDYPEVNYINNVTKVNITCSIHGKFKQSPANHLLGRGCPKCGAESTGNKKRNTIDNFILKSNEIHNNIYDYSKSEYINNRSKIIITCKLHGDFLKEPAVHLKGHGCPTCTRDSKFTNTEDFIEAATKKYADKYDYSKVVCKGYTEKVEIICKNHGIFEQSLLNHLKSEGCKECIKEDKTKNIEEFIEKAKEIHGDKYEYKDSIYVGAKTKISIECKTHGNFMQIPSTHLNGGGCQKCGIEVRAEKRRLTTKQFVKKAKEVHGDEFDYNKVIYVDGYTKVEIHCKKHNHIFYQSPSGHLSGNGCLECSGKAPLTTTTFIEKANIIHKNTYNYLRANYINTKIKVKITCPIHGDFEQSPNSHLRGKGCADCAKEISGFKRSDYIKKANGRLCTFYTIRCFNNEESFYKIGITMNTTKERYSSTRTMPYNYEIISEIFGEASFIWDLEVGEKRKLKEFNYQPATYFAGSKTECFTQYKL